MEEVFFEITDGKSFTKNVWDKDVAEDYFHEGYFVNEVRLATIYQRDCVVRTIVTTQITDESFFQ